MSRVNIATLNWLGVPSYHSSNRSHYQISIQLPIFISSSLLAWGNAGEYLLDSSGPHSRLLLQIGLISQICSLLVSQLSILSNPTRANLEVYGVEAKRRPWPTSGPSAVFLYRMLLLEPRWDPDTEPSAVRAWADSQGLAEKVFLWDMEKLGSTNKC